MDDALPPAEAPPASTVASSTAASMPCELIVTSPEGPTGNPGPAPAARDPNWGRVATGTVHAYDTTQGPQAPTATFLVPPQDRYKPTSVGKKKSSFLITREDLEGRGEAWDSGSDEDAADPQPM
eukprot:TRINITY_DN10335_c0_g1_i1.p2 TRINITY_DN10335_c0_g1~~TRINITY_DN10335_c0_g1_i1.p2  ORF type:complete len:131 (+),score=28.40 TRINITY_DN10335_c0_g1_i1:23-394(+)